MCNGKWVAFEVRQDINSMFWQLLLYDLEQIISLTSLSLYILICKTGGNNVLDHGAND